MRRFVEEFQGQDIQFARIRDVRLDHVGAAHLAEAIVGLARDVMVGSRPHQLALHELSLEGNRRPYLGQVVAETSQAFQDILVQLCRKAGAS